MGYTKSESKIELKHIEAEIDTCLINDRPSHTEVTISEKDSKFLTTTFTIYTDEDVEYELKQIDKKVALMKLLDEFTQEMEGYSYYSSNPGISVDDYEEVAKKIMKEWDLK